jgi:xylose isomerase
MNGASTNPNFDVVACAGTQVKNSMMQPLRLVVKIMFLGWKRRLYESFEYRYET